MDYILDGVGNELLAFFIVYFCIFIAILLTNGFSHNSVRNLKYIWSYLKNLFRSDISTTEEEVTESTEIENEQNPASDIRVFNTGCCVCLNDDCEFPVTSVCGHCFCGICAMNLIEHNSVPIKCPFCRQECRVLFLPNYDPRSISSDLHRTVIRSVTTYNSRAAHRIPFLNRIRDVPVIIRHLMGSFAAFHTRLVFRLKCHVIAALFFAPFYVFWSADIIPDEVFGLVGFIDDVIVLAFLLIVIARTYTNIDSSITFEDIRAALE